MRPSAQAFAADSCSDLLVFLLDMNNAPFVIDSVFISLSLIKGAYQVFRSAGYNNTTKQTAPKARKENQNYV